MRWAVLALLLSGCLHRHRPTYIPLDLPLPEQPADSDPEVRTNIAWAMERGRLPRLHWSPGAGLPEREVAADELPEVPAKVLWTAWVCSPRRMRGGEIDVLVPSDGPPIPLTVQVDMDGGVHLRQGAAMRAPTGGSTDREAAMHALSARHGMGVADGERSWSVDELAIVDRALELLDAREHRLLEGLLLSRDAVSPRNIRELALYDPKEQPVVIHVYDGAFAAGAWSFVGEPDRPIPAPVMTLVHEFGHVVSDAPMAAAWARYTRASTAYLAAQDDRTAARAQLRLARRELRKLGRRGPVIRSFAAIRPGRLWPTTWSTDVFESFAEAFALYRTDPDALMRVAPAAHAWFEADQHLAWREFPG